MAYKNTFCHGVDITKKYCIFDNFILPYKHVKAEDIAIRSNFFRLFQVC